MSIVLSSLMLRNKLTLLLLLTIALLIVGGFFTYQRFFFGSSQEQPVEEVDLSFDPEGPYALLYPRRDGNALALNIKRTGSYDSIKYELSYNSEGIDRGASGDINTNQKKGEYEQEILFGSCSTGGKCVYDKEVENGTLIFHIRKGKEAYRMITQWHLQKPYLVLGVLTSGDAHFSYKVSSSETDLSLIKYTIVNDLSGAPKLPADKNVVGKVYALHGPLAKDIPAGTVNIELAEDPPAGSIIVQFNEAENRWVEYETQISGSKLSATVPGGGIFTVLASPR